MDFVVVDGNEDHAVIAQEIARQKEPRIHHGKPVGMIMPAVFAVFPEKTFAGHQSRFVLVADPA